MTTRKPSTRTSAKVAGNVNPTPATINMIDLSVYSKKTDTVKEGETERNSSGFSMIPAPTIHILEFAGITKLTRKYDNGVWYVSNISDIDPIPVEVLAKLASGEAVADNVKVWKMESPMASTIYKAFYSTESPKTKGYAYGFGMLKDMPVFYVFQGTGVKIINI